MSRFVYGNRPNVPELMVQSGETYRIFTDQLGSPLYIVNIHDASDVLLSARYDAWGQVTEYTVNGLEGQPWPIPFGFAGGLYDEDTGLVRFGARDYDPSIGRWISKDPILFGGGQANLYVYVGGDAVNFVDPEGEIAFVAVPFVLEGALWAAAGAAAIYTWAELELGTKIWDALSLSGRHTPDQAALIGLAKEAKRTGLGQGDAETMVRWGKEYGLTARGPEAHPNRPHGKNPHIHIDSVDHIPVCGP